MIFSNVRKEMPVAQRLRGQNHFTASPNKYRNKSNNARNIDRESVSIIKLLRWVLLASEHAPASPTCTASPLARTSPFTATLQNSRCRERITFPIRKFFRSDVESIESVGAVGAVFEECSFSAGYESGKPMTPDSASFSLPLSLRKPLRPRLTPAA